MRWLLIPLLWLAAVIVALALLWRMWRGKNIVLTGRFGPRFVRMVVVVLVVLGVGIEKKNVAADEARTAPPGARPELAEEELPPSVNSAVIGKWLATQYPRSPWSRIKQQLVRIDGSPTTAAPIDATLQANLDTLPAKFRAILSADLSARASGKSAPRVSAEEMSAALSEMEEAGYYDSFLAAYVFRQSALLLSDGIAQRPQAEPALQLYARLRLHARIVSMLIRAQARVKPIMLRPRAWMSKAYNPAWERLPMTYTPMSLAEMVGACKVLYASSNLGTWERDGLALFTVGKQSAPLSLARPFGPLPKTAGQELRLGRLDVIETPAAGIVTIDSAWLGELRLPASRTIWVWELPRYLSTEARAKIAQTISDAMSGNEAAAERLETHLPLLQRALREALSKQPQAKGAPRLRMILSSFDDAVMPALLPSPVSGYAEEP